MAAEVVCCSCAKQIEGKFLKNSQRHYHPECFTCQFCKASLEPGFYNYRARTYCEKCFQTEIIKRCPCCAECGKPVTPGGKHVKTVEKHYHLECFICQVCKQRLDKDTFCSTREKILICVKCIKKSQDVDERSETATESEKQISTGSDAEDHEDDAERED